MPPSTRSTFGGLRLRPVGAHRLAEIEGLVADAFQRGMREFGGAGVAGEAEQRAAHAGIPVGRAEADEGRHQIDALHGIGFVGERAGLGRLLDDAEPVAQPLHRGAGDEDRAFQRVGAFAVELIGDGGEQLVLRGDRRGAGVEQRKAAGAVGRLDHAGRRSRPGRWSRPAGRRRCRRSRSRRRTGSASLSPKLAEESFTSGSIERGTRRIFRSSSSHCAGVDVEQQRARGVGGVGRVHLAAGQPPQQIAIDGAEHQFAAARRVRARRARGRGSRRLWFRRNRDR